MRKLFLMTADGLVDITEERESRRASTTGSATPYIIQDSMDATWHPITGEFIESKSEFRRRTKQAGCEELGNDRPQARKEPLDTPGRKEALLDAWEYAEAQSRK